MDLFENILCAVCGVLLISFVFGVLFVLFICGFYEIDHTKEYIDSLSEEDKKVVYDYRHNTSTSIKDSFIYVFSKRKGKVNNEDK